MGRKREKLLDMLACERIGTALETALGSDSEYQGALEKQKEAIGRLEELKLGQKWETAADRAVSATNHCGAVYGAVAYRLGLWDGIRLVSEMGEIA